MAFQIIRGDFKNIEADAVGSLTDRQKSPAGETSPKADLRACCDEALRGAAGRGCRSIVFPFSSGSEGGLSGEERMRVITDAFLDFLEHEELEIILAVSEEPEQGGDAKVSGGLFTAVDTYVEDKLRGIFSAEFMASEEGMSLPVMELDIEISQFDLGLDDEQTTAPAQPSMPPQIPSMPPMPSMARSKTPRFFSEKRQSAARRRVALTQSAVSLDDRLRGMYTDSFEKHLQQIINKKGMKNAEVYAAANISKQYFSRLMKGQVKPSKEKVLSLAVGLRLNLDETVDFLKIAGYALSPVSQTDIIVEYFIQNRDYNVMKIDIVLFDYGLPTLSG